MYKRRCAAILVVGVLCLAMCRGADAVVLKTYITGETAPGTPGEKHVIFTVTFDPAVPSSGSVVTTLEDTIHRLDGIDFVPGTGEKEVVAAGTFLAAPDGFVGHYDVSAGVILPDYIPSTKIAVPGPPIITHPSSVLSTPTHFYYTENQFGFEALDPHRIIRKPFAGGPAEIVFDGAAGGGLVEFEGLEIFDDRLYFFTRDPADASKRALMSIGLAGGIWDFAAPVAEISGLARGAPAGVGPGASDGADELDFDPISGLIWGTNIANGELIAYDPVLDVGGVVVTGGAVAGGLPGGLGLLGRSIDGIRSSGEGHLLFTGLDGVLGSIDLGAFIGGGGLGGGSITDGDVFALIDAPGVYAFDDLTPLTVPEPSALLLALVGLTGLGVVGWRRRRNS